MYSGCRGCPYQCPGEVDTFALWERIRRISGPAGRSGPLWARRGGLGMGSDGLRWLVDECGWFLRSLTAFSESLGSRMQCFIRSYSHNSRITQIPRSDLHDEDHCVCRSEKWQKPKTCSGAQGFLDSSPSSYALFLTVSRSSDE